MLVVTGFVSGWITPSFSVGCFGKSGRETYLLEPERYKRQIWISPNFTGNKRRAVFALSDDLSQKVAILHTSSMTFLRVSSPISASSLIRPSRIAGRSHQVFVRRSVRRFVRRLVGSRRSVEQWSWRMLVAMRRHCHKDHGHERPAASSKLCCRTYLPDNKLRSR